MLSEVWRLLLDLDPYGGTDSLGMIPPFLKITSDVPAQAYSTAYPSGQFVWANVSPISKGPPSSSVANYRPISLTSVSIV